MGFNKKRSISNYMLLSANDGCILFYKKFICDRFFGYLRFLSDFF